MSLNKISIIIPLYNVEPIEYKRCVDSLLDAKIRPYEIIVIDDGSKAELSEVYKSLYTQVDEVHYYRQENKGVSAARNHGLRIATGNYVGFVDCDDAVSKTYIADCLDILEKYDDLDLITGYFTEVNCESDIPVKAMSEEQFLTEEKMKSLYYALQRMPQDDVNIEINGSPCGKIYKIDIAKKVKFPENIKYFEDQIFNRCFLKYVKSAVVTTNVWYYYFQREGSAIHSINNDNYIEKHIPFWNCWAELNEKENDIEIKKQFLVQSLGFFCNPINYFVTDGMSWKTIKKSMDKIVSCKLFDQMKRELPYKFIEKKSTWVKLFSLKHRLFWVLYLYECIYIKFCHIRHK